MRRSLVFLLGVAIVVATAYALLAADPPARDHESDRAPAHEIDAASRAKLEQVLIESEATDEAR